MTRSSSNWNFRTKYQLIPHERCLGIRYSITDIELSLFVVQLKYLTLDLKLTITEKIFVLFAPKQRVLVSNRNFNLKLSTPEEVSRSSQLSCQNCRPLRGQWTAWLVNFSPLYFQNTEWGKFSSCKGEFRIQDNPITYGNSSPLDSKT